MTYVYVLGVIGYDVKSALAIVRTGYLNWWETSANRGLYGESARRFESLGTFTLRFTAGAGRAAARFRFAFSLSDFSSCWRVAATSFMMVLWEGICRKWVGRGSARRARARHTSLSGAQWEETTDLVLQIFVTFLELLDFGFLGLEIGLLESRLVESLPFAQCSV